VDAFWRSDVPRLGVRAGLFHTTTGYSLPDAVSAADLIAGLDPLTPQRVYSEVRAMAERTWRERGFFRLLNRWLFRAAEPAGRAAVLAQFYTRPEPLIARFYGARLTNLDRLRLLTGRPPVPIWRALAQLRG
jgi:lycopene beta-cyclase